MGFARQVKAELARVLPGKGCCRGAELAGFAQASSPPAGRGEGGGPGLVVVAETRHSAIARKLVVLGRARFGWAPRVEGVRGSGRRLYRIQLPAGQAAEWEALQRWKPSPGKRGSCCRQAYLRGAFLAAGYLVEPRKGYHMEWVLPTEAAAARVRKALAAEGLSAGLVERKGTCVVYLKEADAIAEVLSLTGAHQSLLEFEDVRVMKGMRNQVNRLVNAETANVDKAVAAALRQVEAIQRLQARGEVEKLPPGLRAVVEARLRHPYASLKELGELMDPPLTKSALNYRMRRLMELAESN